MEGPQEQQFAWVEQNHFGNSTVATAWEKQSVRHARAVAFSLLRSRGRPTMLVADRSDLLRRSGMREMIPFI